jgi:RHS repeat-associated protein
VPITGYDATGYKFIGKERDKETGLDYFGARSYSNGLARFITPDPGKINFKHLINQQKWNKYTYVLNNPLGYFDPDGQAEVKISYDAFIPQKTVFGFRGDNRSFSTDPNASARVRVTMRIETDPAKNGGHPLIGAPEVHVGETHIMGTPESMNKQSNGPQLPTAAASQDSNGNVTLNLQMNMRDPFQPAGQGAASNVNITVNEAATSAEVKGTVSGSPSFEANFTPEGGPTTNLPIQSSPEGTYTFLRELERTNQVDKKQIYRRRRRRNQNDPASLNFYVAGRLCMGTRYRVGVCLPQRDISTCLDARRHPRIWSDADTFGSHDHRFYLDLERGIT